MRIKIIIGAPKAKLTDVTNLDRVSINPVKAGSSAPILANISSKVGTIKINNAKLIVTASTKQRQGK